MATCPWTHVTALLCSLLCFACVSVLAVRKENRCMRHYMVETIQHPYKHCRNKEILLTKCEGYCNKSRTLPRISFSPVLFRPFKHHCSCCRDRLSIMKAVALQCEGERWCTPHTGTSSVVGASIVTTDDAATGRWYDDAHTQHHSLPPTRWRSSLAHW